MLLKILAAEDDVPGFVEHTAANSPGGIAYEPNEERFARQVKPPLRCCASADIGPPGP
jgi:hypothetical protein